jgi:hypothetical protein
MALKKSWYISVVATLIVIGIVCLGGCFKVEPPSVPPDTPPETSENTSPSIHYMAAQQQVLPSSTTEVRCVATDADDDTLSYTWSADGGVIDGDGSTIMWTAPEEEGDYTIEVTVSDGNGAVIGDSTPISVVSKPNLAPVVSLIVKPEGKPEVTVTQDTATDMKEIRVPRNDTAEIHCIAEDPDGDDVQFAWAATGGRVTGEGAEVLYLASEKGKQSVTVTAIDSHGAKTRLSAYFDIPCCGAQ